ASRIHAGMVNSFATRFEVREGEYLIDKHGEMMRDGAHPLHCIHLIGAELAEYPVGQQLSVAGESGERRAQLVAHGREEIRLREIGCLWLLQESRAPERKCRSVREEPKPVLVAVIERLCAPVAADDDHSDD